MESTLNDFTCAVQSPYTPEESFEDDQENVHPADIPRGAPPTRDEEEESEGYPVYLQPPQPLQPVYLHPPQPLQQQISDEDLAAVVARFEVQSSHTGPDGFGAGSSLAAELQHHLNVANSRVEQLEGMVDTLALTNLRAVEEENEELIARVADLTVQNVMMGIGHQAGAGVVSSLWMAVVVLIVLVVALLVRGW